MTARKTIGLTSDDLQSLAAGLAAGKRVTVYLRDPMPSLDLEAGASARVISIDGSTVTVRPKGVEDQLPFEADELEKARPTSTPTTSVRQRSASGRPVGVTTAGSSKPVAAKPLSTSRPAPDNEPVRPEVPAPKQAATTGPRRSRASTAAVSVTVTSVSESAWTVSVAHGSKKQGRPSEVSAERVVRAMQELGNDAAIAAVDGVIESARAAAKKRIDDLSRELDTARAVLARLDGQVADN